MTGEEIGIILTKDQCKSIYLDKQIHAKKTKTGISIIIEVMNNNGGQAILDIICDVGKREFHNEDEDDD